MSTILRGALVTFLFFSCKPQTESKLESLDNLAAGGLRVNECRAKPGVTVDRENVPAIAGLIPPLGPKAEKNKSKLSEAMVSALAVVPKPVQELFIAMNGKILVTDSVADICLSHYKDPQTRKYLSETRNKPTSCAVLYQPPGKDNTVFNIVLGPTTDDIYHGLTRVFGGLIAELFSQIDFDTQTRKFINTHSETEKFIAAKRKLANRFISELHKSKAFSLGPISALFGKYGYKELSEALYVTGGNPDEDIFDLLTFAESRNERMDEFKLFARQDRVISFMFAEAFDSRFCNEWGPYNDAVISKIKTSGEGLEHLKNMKNTHEIAKAFFPLTMETFSKEALPEILSEINIVLAKYRNGGAVGSYLRGSEQGLTLQGHRGRRSAPKSKPTYESPAWAGTKAFFGSIWDNTGGAASQAYGDYREAVGKAVDKHYDGSIISTTGKAVGQVGSDYYKDYYDRTQEKTQNRIDTLQRGGMSNNMSYSYGVGLAFGDVIGATDIAEGVGGIEFEHARELDGMERTQRVAGGTAKLAGTGAGVYSMGSRMMQGTRPAGNVGSTLRRNSPCLVSRANGIALTDPTLPDMNLLDVNNNLSIKHYYHGLKEHANPIHYHVERNGHSVGKLDMNGRLLENQGMTRQELKAIEEAASQNKRMLHNRGDRINRVLRKRGVVAGQKYLPGKQGIPSQGIGPGC